MVLTLLFSVQIGWAWVSRQLVPRSETYVGAGAGRVPGSGGMFVNSGSLTPGDCLSSSELADTVARGLPGLSAPTASVASSIGGDTEAGCSRCFGTFVCSGSRSCLSSGFKACKWF